MKIVKSLKIVGIVISSIFVLLYGLFLILPFVLSNILNNYIPSINEEIKKTTGLVSEIENIKLVTTPKLTMGAKLGKLVILTPDKEKVLSAEDLQVKMSLIPLLFKKFRIDIVKLGSIEAYLRINKDGSLEILKYFPKEEKTSSEQQITSLPIGLELSNKLPDIRLGDYTVALIDATNGKKYVIKGNKTDITDFVFNRSVKISTDGNITLDGREQFKYKIKINNQIMPENELNDFVFNPKKDEGTQQNLDINVLDILKELYKYKISADLDADLNITKDSNNGYLNITKCSLAPSGVQLPDSNVQMKLQGSKIVLDSNIYTATNEVSTITGEINTNKNLKLDINIKSKAELANLVKIVNAIAQVFNINDLKTLSATGKIDADFNIKSDLKTIKSNGYLKIPSAVVRYGLYNLVIDKINADVLLNNNNINIANLGFSIFNQPLVLKGTINEDTNVNLKLIATNLNLRGLLIAAGQGALLKENNITSGVLTAKVDLIGKLDKIKPKAVVTLSDIVVKNIPADTTIKCPYTDINIVADGQAFNGTAVVSSIKAINPAITVSVSKVMANIKNDMIQITQAPIGVEKINFNVVGSIKDYMSNKIALDFVSSGDIKANLSGNINVPQQTMNMVLDMPQTSTIIIPMFDKSKMSFCGNIKINGDMVDPNLSGVVNVPSINIPEIPVIMTNSVFKINGKFLNGNLTVAKLKNNGIVAENIVSDYSLKGETFYLNNLKATAFLGKVGGDIAYNIATAKTDVNLHGENLNAELAMAGATGIKNALTGVMNFNTKISLFIKPNYEEMVKSMGGTLAFKINDGAFSRIGTLDQFLHANNMVGNALLKNTVTSFSNVGSIKDSAQFDNLSGNMTFNNGYAHLNSVKSAGKTLTYYVTGKYYIPTGYTNVNILGRMDGSIVKSLGVVGEMSVEKVLSFIPKLGAQTKNMIVALTTDPKKEKVEEIPNLTNGSKVYKDFKVVFNGHVTNPASIKTFKWLNKPDLTEIQQTSVTSSVKDLQKNVQSDVNSTVNTVKDIVNDVKTQKEAIKQQAQNLKTMFKF